MAGAMGAGSRQGEKQFTVASANRTLPLVRAIVGDIVSLHRDVSDRKSRLDSLRGRKGKSAAQQRDDMYRDEVVQEEKNLDRDVARLQGYVEELNDIGIELKDPHLGLVDFPTVVNGQKAFLCWQLGESEVQTWHSPEVGYANREPLNTRPADHAV